MVCVHVCVQITTHCQVVVAAVVTDLIGVAELWVVVDEVNQSGVVILPATFIAVSVSFAYSDCHIQLL